MLSPDSRTLFLDTLRPPDEFELDQAIATTYSLDLTAMLLAPLAFARLDGYERPPVPGQTAAENVDPFALLKSLRGYAERMTVFCQAGQLCVPRGYQRLYTYLEQSLVPVAPRAKLGVFHPKVWALRYVRPDGAVHYRLLCLSRNLTFDSSWDTALVLDGELNQERTRAYSGNHALGDFFAALPSLAVTPASATVTKRAQRFADELRRVDFELPEDFEQYAFQPLGIEGYQAFPFEGVRADARLVISPFVTDKALGDLPGKAGTLVSRIDELDALRPETLALFKDVYVLDDAAESTEDAPELDGPIASQWRPPPSGLHAKVYVFDAGHSALVFSGSANATTAAFTENVEFLLPLEGKRSKVGVAATLEAIRPLLQPYTGRGRAEPGLTEAEKLEALVRQARAAIARLQWKARAVALEDQRFSLTLTAEAPLSLPPGASVSVYPLTVSDGWKAALDSRSSVSFSPCSFEALTSFFVFELSATLGEHSVIDAFVVSAPLEGAPENRLARVLDSILENPAAVMRFLRLLLADTPGDILEALEAGLVEGDGPGGSRGGANEPPLLESMLRALAREPAKLDAIAQVMEDLKKLDGGLARLPPGFLEAWEPILAARAAMGGAR